MIQNLSSNSITNITNVPITSSNTNKNVTNSSDTSNIVNENETIQSVEGSLINVRIVTLPKGQYVKLKAHDPAFYKLPEAPNDMYLSQILSFALPFQIFLYSLSSIAICKVSVF
jgi:hypothetical protein